MELDKKLKKQVEDLTQAGDNLADQEKYGKAAKKFEDALALLPAPAEQWKEATWLYTSAGDMYFIRDEFERARTALVAAMRCPGAASNPFIHLRLGQAELELGDETRAAEELARAYEIEGEKIFEDEEPKYLEFLRSKSPPPFA